MARSSLIPGFRFHPTDVELVMYYLKKKLTGQKITVNVVAEVNIYDFSPWDLPDKSSLKSGDLEWYFFCPKSKKYLSGGRANRATETGFWKATGRDRKVNYNGRTVAIIKTLIFHRGHAGKGERTDWVMHEYRMEDEQLANAGIVQDTYVLCKIYEKSGSGPKNGAQYGAPFDEEQWNDDLACSSDSQAFVGLVGASNLTVRMRECPATTSMTEPGSSVVIFSVNEPTNTLNYKQKGPATKNVTEPCSSMTSFSADEPTNKLTCEQKDKATMKMTEPGSSMVTFSANEPTDTPTYKQKCPSTVDMTELGSSMVTFSANEPTSTLNCKQKGPATMNMTVPQTIYRMAVSEPGSSSAKLSTDELPANDDVIFLEDIDPPMPVPEEPTNEDDGIYGSLMNLINLDDLNTDGPEFNIDELLSDDLDLGKFYVD